MQQFNFIPFPVLFTERLILRQLEIRDDQEISFLRSNEFVNKYIDRAKHLTIEQSQAFINEINHNIYKNRWLYWAICFRDEKKLVGTICYWNFSEDKRKAELGYELQPDFQGLGIMQEALSKVIDFGFQNLKLHTVDAYTQADNARSIKLLTKSGFAKQADVEVKKGCKEVVYALTKTV